MRFRPIAAPPPRAASQARTAAAGRADRAARTSMCSHQAILVVRSVIMRLPNDPGRPVR
jgi:hypothetical protein